MNGSFRLVLHTRVGFPALLRFSLGASANAVEPALVPIFDGRTLAGWHVSDKTGHGTGGRWVVEQGASWEMTPDQGLFATGVGSERTLNAALRSYRGDQALAYISSQCTFTLHLDKIAAKSVRVTWIDPKSGERRDVGTFLTGNENGKQFPEMKTQTFTVPGHWEDAALLLEAVR